MNEFLAEACVHVNFNLSPADGVLPVPVSLYMDLWASLAMVEWSGIVWSVWNARIAESVVRERPSSGMF